MSAQALDELRAMTATLESLSNGGGGGVSEAAPRGISAESIISSASTDLKNPWREFLLIQKLSPTAVTPTKANESDAGYDLYSFGDYTIPPWQSKLIATQIKVGLPHGTYGRIAPRSSMSVKNIEVGAGVVDQGYQGELKVLLRNLNDEPYTVKNNDKIAQMILEVIKSVPVKVVSNVQEIMGKSGRGDGGFGSSGR